MTENTPEGTLLRVDFDEVTRKFSELRPIVAKASSPQELIRIVHPVMGEIFLKYFEFPNSRLYNPEDLNALIQHVMDCITNITPPHIPYRSVSVEGKWMLVRKEGDDPKPS